MEEHKCKSPKSKFFNGKKGDREKQTDPAREEAKAELKRD